MERQIKELKEKLKLVQKENLTEKQALVGILCLYICVFVYFILVYICICVFV